MSNAQELERKIEEMLDKSKEIQQAIDLLTEKSVQELEPLVDRAIAAYKKYISDDEMGNNVQFAVGPDFLIHVIFPSNGGRLWEIFLQSVLSSTEELVASNSGGASIKNGRSGQIRKWSTWRSNFEAALCDYETGAEVVYIENLQQELCRISESINEALDNLGVASVEELLNLAGEGE